MSPDQERRARMIGRRLRYYRQVRSMSQEKLAATSGMTLTTVNRTELGKSLPTIDTLERLADVLDVRIVDFFLTPGMSVETSMTYFQQYLRTQGFPKFLMEGATELAFRWAIHGAQSPQWAS